MDAIDDLTRLPASEVKKRGWRGVMRTLHADGTVVVTNHDEPEAVIIPVREYTRLREIVERETAATEAAIETLRRRFDERLAALDARDAADRLRSLVRRPARLKGKVKAGHSH
ncbi:MAG TPA: type II toxin-antitoxin system prevent-host-death family antitoxin [Vicinamibacterales bacterium]|nr:type II toxin-antitoxin system prevent-host-death family antitoxin [Vicinamibacterales bacterium]